ncbi:hypothetical protein LPJGGPFB_05278 [Ensifer adhaerens]|uniref:Uncharacterized protein n=1 Tax=Ensifer adhaerens TaxID=106592 RepID=A0ACC5T498_ENSAD|nr:hypothetical protein [Ensifer adhaerens]NRP22019.1 hypothetical protein [Ensifer adhaerens]
MAIWYALAIVYFAAHGRKTLVFSPEEEYITPGNPAGARATVVTGLSLPAAARTAEVQIDPDAYLMSDEATAFMALGENYARHDTVKHSSREHVRDAVHVNSVEGFNARVRRTIAGVFHHISPQHVFHEIGFRWSQRIVTGQAVRKSRNGKEPKKTMWSRAPPALQLLQSFAPRPAVSCAEVRMLASSSNQQSLPLVDMAPIMQLFWPIKRTT